MTKIHSSLDFLGDTYKAHKEAVSEYERLREELFGEMKQRVRDLIDNPRNSEESVLMPLGKMHTRGGTCVLGTKIPRNLISVEGILVRGGIIVNRKQKTLEGFDGNCYVFGGFFGSKVDNGMFTTSSGEELVIQFEKEKTDIIEKARYQGVRYREGILFQELMKNFGDDCKAIQLYSGGYIQEIRCFIFEGERNPLDKLGNWDYVDVGYCTEEEGRGELKLYHEGTIETLENLGILNPFCIKPIDDYEAKSANNISAWRNATSGNKTTRMVGAYVGGKNWPPKEIEYGSYDIAYAESDQTSGNITAEELYKLAKIGGFIVLPVWMMGRCKSFKDRVKVLLNYKDGDFAFLQKIS